MYGVDEPGLKSTKLDLLHEGESLGTAVGIMKGQKSYKDIIFLHGFFKDPGIAILAFKLFGRSVFSYRSLQSILNILALILLSALLVKYSNHEKNHPLILYSFFLTLIFFKPFGLGYLLLHRDIPLMVMALIILHGSRNQVSPTQFFFLTFIAFSTLAYSVDRGTYLSLSAILWSIIITWCSKEQRMKLVIAILGGTLAGLLLFSLVISWEWEEFVSFTYIHMPRYKDIMDGFVYKFKSYPYMVFVLLISFNLFTLLVQVLNTIPILGLRKTLLKKSVEIFLAITGILYFKSALGRGDLGHIWYSLLPTYLLLPSSIFWYIQCRLPNTLRRITLISAIGFVISTTLLKVKWKDWYNFSSFEDKILIDSHTKTIVDHLKDRIEKYGGGFVTLTNEPGWYYLLNVPSGIRFYALLHGIGNIYQKEMIQDLKRNNVQVILLTSRSWTNRIDGLQNSDRFRILFDYIIENYKLDIKIDGTEIYVRK